MSRIRLGIVMDPVDSIKIEKDTTLAFMKEAQARGWELYYLTLNDLYMVNGIAMGHVRELQITFDASPWYRLSEFEDRPLSDLDILLMRKDPPFDVQYILATYILERAEMDGCFVVNSPKSLRDVNEKAFTAWFPQCCPPSLISRSKEDIGQFLEAHNKVVIKPIDRMSGQSVFLLEKGHANTQVIIEEVTDRGRKYANVQLYIPEVKKGGDKRILLIDGVPLTQGLARIPMGDDHRGNLAVGAKPQGFELNERDRWICEQIGPVLQEKGLFFVGIDVIGDYMTELNVTSPTGVIEIDAWFDMNISALFLDKLLAKFEMRGKNLS